MSFVLENGKPTFKFNQPLSKDVTQVILNYFLGINRPVSNDAKGNIIGHFNGWSGNNVLATIGEPEAGSNLQAMTKNNNFTPKAIQGIYEEVEAILQNMIVKNQIIAYDNLNVYAEEMALFIKFSAKQFKTSPFAGYLIDATNGILSQI